MDLKIRGNNPTQNMIKRLPLVFMSLLALTLIVNCTGANQPQVPADFQPLAEIDLTVQSHDADVVAEIEVEETAVIGIFFTIQEIDTPYFDLSLTRPDGESQMLLHGEDFRTDKHGSGSWEDTLAPGVYQLVLTADQSPGVLTVYIKK